MSPFAQTFPKNHRISVELYAMCLAWVASLRSEDPYHKVGCVALNSSNRVVATGYNGLKPGEILTEAEWADRDGRLKHVIHAERNAISLCSKNEIDTLAVTTLPCPDCAQAVIDHGVKTILYGKLYHRDSSSLQTFAARGIQVKHVALDNARFEVLGAIHRELSAGTQ